jgi:hypothetical protein
MKTLYGRVVERPCSAHLFTWEHLAPHPPESPARLNHRMLPMTGGYHVTFAHNVGPRSDSDYQRERICLATPKHLSKILP